MVIGEDLCDPRYFTGETRGGVMMDVSVVEVPVVKRRVDTPYYIGEVEGVAMKAHIYDAVMRHVQKTGGVVTRLESKDKPLRPMKVAR